MTALLEAREVTKTFGGGLLDRRHTVALRDFSLGLAEGRPSVTAVVGESGSGKTTLARLLLGLLTPTEGQVAYRGRDLAAMSRAEWRTFRREVQAIFQDPYEVYNPFYRVDHVLTMPVAKFRLATSRAGGPSPDRGRAPRGRAPPRRDAGAIPAPALRRPAPARHGGAGAAPAAARDPGRRARVDGGRLAPGHDPRGAPPDDARPPDPGDLHHARPGDRVPDRENIVVLYRGAVVEAGDVELVVKRSPAPVHAAPRRLHPPAGHRADVDGRQRAGPGERARPRRALRAVSSRTAAPRRCRRAGRPRRLSTGPELIARPPASSTRTRPRCRRTRWRRSSSNPAWTRDRDRPALRPPRRCRARERSW